MVTTAADQRFRLRMMGRALTATRATPEAINAMTLAAVTGTTSKGDRRPNAATASTIPCDSR